MSASSLDRAWSMVKARLDGHTYTEPWDRGYHQGLRDAMYDIREVSADERAAGDAQASAEAV